MKRRATRNMHAYTSVVSHAGVPVKQRKRLQTQRTPRRCTRVSSSADADDRDECVEPTKEHETLPSPASVSSSTGGAPTATKPSRRLSLTAGFASVVSLVTTTLSLPATAGEVLEQLQALLADAEQAIELDPENDQLLGQRTFFENQVERVQLNASFVDRLRGRVEKGDVNYLQRLRFSIADDLWEDEVYFWKNAMGCRVTREILDDKNYVIGVCLAFGQESLTADDGGKAAIELLKKGSLGIDAKQSQSHSNNSKSKNQNQSFSYVSLSVPYGVRVSRIYEAGGELVYGFGYFDVRSPSGYAVRARVAARRDPVELVALNVANIAESVKFYETNFGMKASAPLDLNGYAPKSPPGSKLMTFGEPKETVGILLQPVQAVEDAEAAAKFGGAFVGAHFVVGKDLENIQSAIDMNDGFESSAGCFTSIEVYEAWEASVKTGAQSLPFKYSEPPPA